MQNFKIVIILNIISLKMQIRMIYINKYTKCHNSTGLSDLYLLGIILFEL